MFFEEPLISQEDIALIEEEPEQPEPENVDESEFEIAPTFSESEQDTEEELKKKQRINWIERVGGQQIKRTLD